MKNRMGQRTRDRISVRGRWTGLFQPSSLPEPRQLCLAGTFWLVNRLRSCSPGGGFEGTLRGDFDGIRRRANYFHSSK